MLTASGLKSNIYKVLQRVKNISSYINTFTKHVSYTEIRKRFKKSVITRVSPNNVRLVSNL